MHVTSGDEEVASPATTPGSIVVDEEKFLVPYSVRVNVGGSGPKWYSVKRLPGAILTISVLEIVFFVVCQDRLQRLLRFEPTKLTEIWRFVTYMLLHEDWLHLVLNVVIQVLFAYFLEIRHGNLRILALYLAGGITGVLGASCFQVDLVIGASGGVYALLIAHLADIMMNYETMKYKVYKCMSILIIVISDVAFNLVHVFSRDEPLISWGAHVFGGLTGLLLGLVFFKGDEKRASVRKLALFWSGLSLYLILMISLVIITMQIKKCTPSNIIRTRYIYFC